MVLRNAMPRTSPQAGCHQRPLAQTDVGSIRACSCGKLHLVVGFLTLHFDTAGLAAMHLLLGRALDALGREGQRAKNDLALLLGTLEVTPTDKDFN